MMPRPSSNVWEHFLTLSKNGTKKHVTCIYCSAQFRHAMANRLKDHLLKCKRCPNDLNNPNATEVTDHDTIKLKKKGNTISCSIPIHSPPQQLLASTGSLHRFNANSLPEQPNNHKDRDTALARAMYASGLPASFLESEYWKKVFQLFDASYSLPTSDNLRDSLLEGEYSRIKNIIDFKIMKSQALTLICDYWTNIIGRRVINFFVATPEPTFYKQYPDSETENEEVDYVCSRIINTLNEIHPEKFVAIIIANIGKIEEISSVITSIYPHITCIECINSSLNLISEVLNRNETYKEVRDKTVTVIEYINYTPMVYAQFLMFQTKQYRKPSPLKLLLPWSEVINTLKSYKINKEALMLTVQSNDINISDEIRDIILDDEMWLKVDEVLKILCPLLTARENDKTWLSDVPLIYQNLVQNTAEELDTISFLTPEEKNTIISILQVKKDLCLLPIHYAAYILDPRYCGEGLNDEKISIASEYIRKYCAAVGLNESKVLKNMACFKLKQNFFHESKAIWSPVKDLEPRIWWLTFASQQHVAVIASKILSVSSSSNVCNKIMKIQSQTWDKNNNYFEPINHKLMSVQINLNLFEMDKEESMILEDSEENIESDDTGWGLEVLDLSDPLL